MGVSALPATFDSPANCRGRSHVGRLQAPGGGEVSGWGVRATGAPHLSETTAIHVLTIGPEGDMVRDEVEHE